MLWILTLQEGFTSHMPSAESCKTTGMSKHSSQEILLQPACCWHTPHGLVFGLSSKDRHRSGFCRVTAHSPTGSSPPLLHKTMLSPQPTKAASPELSPSVLVHWTALGKSQAHGHYHLCFWHGPWHNFSLSHQVFRCWQGPNHSWQTTWVFNNVMGREKVLYLI